MISDLSDCSCEKLQSFLTPDIANIVEEAVSTLQSMVRGNGRMGALVKRLHSLGTAIGGAPWLLSSLNGRLRSTISQWPTESCIDALFKLRADAMRLRSGAKGKKAGKLSSLPGAIDHYLAVPIAGADPFTDEQEKRQVEILLEIWHRIPYSDTRAAALAIAQHDFTPTSVRCRCLSQLHEMRVDFIRKVIIYMTSDTEMACVNFAELLLSKYVTEDVRATWSDLLLWMIDMKKENILEYTLSRFDLTWFKWLRNIRTIFQDRLRHDSEGSLILSQHLHSWTNQLYENFLPTLTRFENIPESSTAIKCI